MSRAFALAVLAVLVLASGEAQACSVCFSATEENRWAFIATTVFLSLAPLGILLGIGTWLRRKVLEMDRRHEAARLERPPA